MTVEMPLGLAVAEKLFGLVLIIVGAFFSYTSLTPPAGDISHVSNIFVVLGVVIVVAGIFLIISKAE